MGEIDASFQAVAGFLQLGMLEDAASELDNLPPELRVSREAMIHRLDILELAGDYDKALMLAGSLAVKFPEDYHWWFRWTTATRICAGPEEALIVIEEALKRHPDSALLCYQRAQNLCAVGQYEESEEMIRLAFKLDSGFRRASIDEEDFEPLRNLFPEFWRHW